MSKTTPSEGLELQAQGPKGNSTRLGIQRPGGATLLGGQTSLEKRWKGRVLSPVAQPH